MIKPVRSRPDQQPVAGNSRMRPSASLLSTPRVQPAGSAGPGKICDRTEALALVRCRGVGYGTWRSSMGTSGGSAAVSPAQECVQADTRCVPIHRLHRLQELFPAPPEWEASQSSGERRRQRGRADITDQII